MRWVGVMMCGNIHACLGCGARIRATRATEIDHLLKSHLAKDRHATLLTFTLPHYRSDSLQRLWDVVQKVYGKVTSGRAIQAIKEMYGIRGFIRSLEITFSWLHGWHVHLHVAVLHDEWLADEVEEGINSLEEFRLRFMARWSQFVQEELGRQIHEVYGVDATAIRDAEGIGNYVSKIHFEMVRGDLKTGGKKSRTPWEIGIDAYHADTESIALWTEYVKASHKRRLLGVTKALRDEYGTAGTEELTDEEIAQQGDEGQLEVQFSAELFDAMRALHRPVLADVQLAYQDGGIEALRTVLEDRGFHGVIVGPDPIEPGVSFVRMQAGHAHQVVADIADQAVARRNHQKMHGPAYQPRYETDDNGKQARVRAWANRLRNSARPQRQVTGSWSARIKPGRDQDDIESRYQQ